jgi:hypothetical protein
MLQLAMHAKIQSLCGHVMLGLQASYSVGDCTGGKSIIARQNFFIRL